MKKRQLLPLLLSMALLAGSVTGCGSMIRVDNEETASGGRENSAAAEEDLMTSDSSWEAAPSEDDGYNIYGAAEEAEAYISEDESYLESAYDYDNQTGYEENTEEYGKIIEQSFKDVLKQPLSTFAADVDTASYSNMRRLIQEGYRIDDFPEGSIRIEELLNYFTYDYQGPKGGEPFGVNTAISPCPWNSDSQLMMIGLQTQGIDFSDAPASNLVFLIDVSGSMYDSDKLPLLQKAFCMLAENLSEKDRVSIVTYAGSDEIIIEGVRGDKTKVITKAIESLEAGGSTNGSDGIITAYELAEDYFIKGGNNRIILATDGDLNVGLTTEDELEELITEKKESGVFLSVLGFGAGNIKDNNMEILADKGNGNYSYIDSIKEARKVLVDELGANLLTICKDVKLQVEFNPAIVESYRLIGYNNRVMDRKDFDDDTKDGGEIGAGHSVTALYEIILKDSITELAEDEIKNLKYSGSFQEELSKQGYASMDPDNEWLTINIRFKKPAAGTSSLLTYPVTAESFTLDPNDDYLFAASVAEFGLIASDSAYQQDSSLEHVVKTLKNLDLNDEYKEEFYELVRDLR